jgi:hypothetical protein
MTGKEAIKHAWKGTKEDLKDSIKPAAIVIGLAIFVAALVCILQPLLASAGIPYPGDHIIAIIFTLFCAVIVFSFLDRYWSYRRMETPEDD